MGGWRPTKLAQCARPQDAFTVRYVAKGQGGLATHTDDSELSCNLLLTKPFLPHTESEPSDAKPS